MGLASLALSNVRSLVRSVLPCVSAFTACFTNTLLTSGEMSQKPLCWWDLGERSRRMEEPDQYDNGKPWGEGEGALGLQAIQTLWLLEDVAYARTGDDVLWIGGIFPDLLPKAGYGYLQNMGIPTILLSPHLGQEVILGYCFAGIACQETEDPVFSRGEQDFIPP